MVYSQEQPIRPIEDMSISCRTHCICPPGAKHKCTERRDIPGSTAFVPSVVGLIIAGRLSGTSAGSNAMDMTLETLTGLEPGSYTLVDLRSAHDIGYGKIPGALEIPAGELEEKTARRQQARNSLLRLGAAQPEPAENLRDAGFDAYSLKGRLHGLAESRNGQAGRFPLRPGGGEASASGSEEDLVQFTKAIQGIRAGPAGDVIGVCISGGKRFHAHGQIIPGTENPQQIPL